MEHNTKQDLDIISTHINDIPDFSTTPLLDWISHIARKLEEYRMAIDEKNKAIDRLLNQIEGNK